MRHVLPAKGRARFTSKGRFCGHYQCRGTFTPASAGVDLLTGPLAAVDYQTKLQQLFDADIYYREIYRPLLLELGVTRAEMRSPPGEKKSLRVA